MTTAPPSRKGVQPTAPEPSLNHQEPSRTKKMANRPDSSESAQDPKTIIFSQGVKILFKHGTSESAARSFLGKSAAVDETKLAGVIGQLMAQPEIEPKAYIVAAMAPKKRGLVL